MMAKASKHRGGSSSHWDHDDEDEPAAVEQTAAPRETVWVKVKCITHLHPWAEFRYLEMDEETDVPDYVATILVDKGFAELVEPPPEARK
jgi:hypothetical protein